MGLTTFALFNLLPALEAADERRSIFGSLILETGTPIKMTFLAALAALVATGSASSNRCSTPPAWVSGGGASAWA